MAGSASVKLLLSLPSVLSTYKSTLPTDCAMVPQGSKGTLAESQVQTVHVHVPWPSVCTGCSPHIYLFLYVANEMPLPTSATFMLKW